MEKKRGKGAEIWGLLSAGMSAGSLREENLLMEAEERKKKRPQGFILFFFSLRTALFLSVPPRQKERVGAIVRSRCSAGSSLPGQPEILQSLLVTQQRLQPSSSSQDSFDFDQFDCSTRPVLISVGATDAFVHLGKP